MLDQLVESRSTAKENTRRGGFMFTTFVVIFTMLIAGWLYSLFAKDYGMGNSDLELSTLVAPVPVPEDEPPPPPKPENEPEKKQVEKDTNVAVRKELIENIFQSTKIPDKTNTENIKFKQMQLGVLNKQGSTDSDATSSGSGPARTGGGNSPGIVAKETKPVVEDDDDTAPVIKTPKPAPKTISGGVVNGKAISLPPPPYPAAAKAVGAKGAVSVQVLIDENGSVVSANAASGHPLLRSAAEQAARRARFRPTQLSGQPVKVSGVITYVFN